MKLFIKEIQKEHALEILNWKYEPPYDFYNNQVDAESISEMLDNPYYVVLDESYNLVGFFCYGKSAQVPVGDQFGAYNENSIDVGIGMNPNLTGKGNGYSFFSFIIKHIQELFPLIPIRLTVAKFNKRAIHLYEKIGFEKKMEFNRETVEFMTMVLKEGEKMSTNFVHHICIQTNHYEESLKFYTEALGFNLIKESPNFHSRHYNSWLQLDSFLIELQTGKIGENLKNINLQSQGIVHLCLWVKDLSTEVQKMKQLGYEFKLKNGQEIYHVENGSLCKVVAPEGTIIELRDNKGI